MNEPNEVQPEAEVDPLDSAVDEAWEKTEEPTSASTEEAPANEEPAPAPHRDERGKFAPKPSVPPAKQPEALEEPTPAAPKPTQAEAPRVLPANVKEVWAKTPQEVRDYIAKREGDAARRETETAKVRQEHAEFQEVVAPYRHLMTRAPAQEVLGLLQTAAALRLGTAGEKAQLVAQIINNFGIDVQQLAHHIDNPQAQQQPQGQPQYRDPRVDAMLAQQQQREAAMYRNEVYRWAKTAEFAESPGIAELMSKLMPPDVGQPVAERLQAAYDAACGADPATRAVLMKRQPRGTATAATQAAKRAAASSIKTSPAPTGGKTPARTVDGVVDELWDQMQGTR